MLGGQLQESVPSCRSETHEQQQNLGPAQRNREGDDIEQQADPVTSLNAVSLTPSLQREFVANATLGRRADRLDAEQPSLDSVDIDAGTVDVLLPESWCKFWTFPGI